MPALTCLFRKENKMNNKILYLAIGVVLGAAGGSAAIYFLVKEKIAAEAEEEIEAYANHCEERIERVRASHNATKEENNRNEKVLDPEEEKIAHNEGVKKYHHNDGISSKYGENRIFGDKPLKPMISNYEEKKDSKLINDIDEDEFMDQENGYEKQTLDVFLGDDKYMCGVWGYGTDNEDDADRKWGKELPELIGTAHTYDELLATTKEADDGIGLLFVRNEEMKIDFELVIHDSREDDKE